MASGGTQAERRRQQNHSISLLAHSGISYAMARRVALAQPSSGGWRRGESGRRETVSAWRASMASAAASAGNNQRSKISSVA